MRHSNHIILPESGKQYKVFLVEVDDDDRERVLSGLAGSIEIDRQEEHQDIYSYDGFISRIPAVEKVVLNIVLQQRYDGTYFTIENFNDIEDDEDA